MSHALIQGSAPGRTPHLLLYDVVELAERQDYRHSANHEAGALRVRQAAKVDLETCPTESQGKSSRASRSFTIFCEVGTSQMCFLPVRQGEVNRTGTIFAAIVLSNEYTKIAVKQLMTKKNHFIQVQRLHASAFQF